ncbi:MAG: hypothetical protein ABFD97_04075 [Syntrophobacter sp.]
MLKKIVIFVSLLCTLGVAGLVAASVFNEGMIDKDLRYQDFRVTEDGFITGVIINTSQRNRSDVRVDMWITNVAETRIFWRKSITLGDMRPGSRFEVRENGGGSVDSTTRVQFMFRLPQKDNYRNHP